MTPRWPDVEYKVIREAVVGDESGVLVKPTEDGPGWASLFRFNAAAVRISTRAGLDNKIVAAIQVFGRGSARNPDDVLIERASAGLNHKLREFLQKQGLIYETD